MAACVSARRRLTATERKPSSPAVMTSRRTRSISAPAWLQRRPGLQTIVRKSRYSRLDTPSAINRTIDVATLSSWLTVRAIDRETRRLDSIEQRMAPSPASPPAIPLPVTASLPAEPTEVSAAPLATDDPLAANVPVPKRDPRGSRAQSRMANPLPAMASLPAQSSNVSATPLATDEPLIVDVPVPKRDPRRFRAKPRMANPARSTDCAAGVQCADSALACAPAGTVRDTACADSRPVRPHQPLVLRPSASSASRPAL